MSQETLEAVRRSYEAFNRGDIGGALEAMDPEIEWHVPAVLPDPETYRGHEGVRQFFEAWSQTFDDFEVYIEEMIDGGDHVVALAGVRGRGKESGILVESPSFGQVWTLRNGKAVRMDMYPNRETALIAIGMTE